MSVTVRPANLSDARAVAQVHVASWQRAYVGIVPQAYLDSLAVDDRLPMWTSVIAGMRQEPHRVFVASDGTCVLGFASTGPAWDDDLGPAWQLYAIYVLPRAWASGVGSALMDAVLAACPSMLPVVLWVAEDNRAARRFYAQHGFVPDGSRRTEEIGGRVLAEVRCARPPRHG